MIAASEPQVRPMEKMPYCEYTSFFLPFYIQTKHNIRIEIGCLRKVSVILKPMGNLFFRFVHEWAKCNPTPNLT